MRIIKGNTDFRNRKSSYHCIQQWAFGSQSWNVMSCSLVVSEETAPSIFTPHFCTGNKSSIFLPDYTTSHPKDYNLNSHSLFLTVSDTSDSTVSFKLWLLPLSAISVLSRHLTFVLITHISSWVNFLGPPYPFHNLPSPSLQYLSNQIRGWQTQSVHGSNRYSEIWGWLHVALSNKDSTSIKIKHTITNTSYL